MTIKTPLSCLLAALALAGCRQTVNPVGNTSVTTAMAASPASGTVFSSVSQPVTLTITNALVTRSDAAVSYTFEVATDSAFANKVLTRDVAQQPTQTSLKLDVLTPGKDYFWHVLTRAGDTVGNFGDTYKFTIALASPSGISPANGAVFSNALQPVTLTVNNAQGGSTGGAVTYTFEVATDAAFASKVLTKDVAQTTNQTSFKLDVLTPSRDYFWHVLTKVDGGVGTFGETFKFTVAGPAAPAASSPANGAQVANSSQPVTLVVTNASAPQPISSILYTFEVATDAGFASKVLTRDVASGTGQTSLKLDTLTPSKDYFWHVLAKIDGVAGPFGDTLKFSIGAPVTIQAPLAVEPVNGAASNQRPTFTVTNATRTGTTGAVVYRFEVASTQSFSPILVSGTVPEGSTRTSFTPSVNLPADASFFWRAQAVDSASNTTSPYSTLQGFSTALAIDLTKVNYQRFVNPSSWAETDTIIGVDQDGSAASDGLLCIDHTKRGLWPAALIDDVGTLAEGTQWYFARINGQWYAGAGESLRPGQICKVGQTSEGIGPDGSWGGPMDTWAPKPGELVGYMVSTPARYYPFARTVDERSNVVVLPWVVNGKTTASSGARQTR